MGSHFGGLAPLAMQHHICLTRRVIYESDEGFGGLWDDDGVKSMRRLDVNLDVALLRPALHEAIQFVRDERRVSSGSSDASWMQDAPVLTSESVLWDDDID